MRHFDIEQDVGVRLEELRVAAQKFCDVFDA
jgi:hypothetical protein